MQMLQARDVEVVGVLVVQQREVHRRDAGEDRDAGRAASARRPRPASKRGSSVKVPPAAIEGVLDAPSARTSGRAAASRARRYLVRSIGR